jgi:peptide/nickel transport system substrate-binding protein
MRYVKVSLLIVSLLAICGVAYAQDLATEQILRYGCESGDLGTMDPAFAKSSDDLPLIHAVFNGLLRFQPGSLNFDNIEGDLAKNWECSVDGLVWTFYLREGVQWHGGYGELTAEDVKFSYDRVINPDVASRWSADYANLERVEIVDAYTLEMHITTPDPFFPLKVVGYHGGYIVSKKAVEELGDDFGLNPIGTGPFVFEEHKPKEKVVLVRNEEYFKGAPIIERIDYLFMSDDSTRLLSLQTGEIDTAGFPSDQAWVQALDTAGLEVDYKYPGNQFHLHFNLTVKPLDNILVRQALAYGIDRNAFLEYRGKTLALLEGSPVPSGYYGHTTLGVRSYDYNPELAKTLLTEAGYPNGFSLGKVVISPKGGYQPYMVIIQEQWRKIGVDMELTVVEHSAYHDLIRQNTNPVVLYNASRVPIADSYLTQFYYSASAIGKPTAVTNFSHYGEVIPGVDEFIELARTEANPEVQKALYAAAQRIIMADLPAYPLFMGISIRARQPYVSFPYIADHKYENLWGAYIFDETTSILQH